MFSLTQERRTELRALREANTPPHRPALPKFAPLSVGPKKSFPAPGKRVRGEMGDKPRLKISLTEL